VQIVLRISLLVYWSPFWVASGSGSGTMQLSASTSSHQVAPARGQSFLYLSMASIFWMGTSWQAGPSSLAHVYVVVYM
jgi:hypothetical protein